MSIFQGPLFIVGLSRSGTKLLRDLLNGHPLIAIPALESHFLPSFTNQYDGKPLDNQWYQAFYSNFKRTTFYWHMANQGIILTGTDLRAAGCENLTEIFEYIFRFYASAGPESIWGDKTPAYLGHMQSLKALFPSSRFLHIIRDPRDRVLSANKAWGKNIYLAAENTTLALTPARQKKGSLGHDYKEVFFETLINQPESVLKEICEFLDCVYDPQMLQLSQPVENLSDKKNSVSIDTSNTGKFALELERQNYQKARRNYVPTVCGAALYTPLCYEISTLNSTGEIFWPDTEFIIFSTLPYSRERRSRRDHLLLAPAQRKLLIQLYHSQIYYHLVFSVRCRFSIIIPSNNS